MAATRDSVVDVVSFMKTPIPVLILGDSFVARLRDYTKRTETRNMGFPWSECTIFFRGIGGAHVPSLWGELDIINTLMPKMVILQIGSNDVCQVQSKPKEVACQIVEFAQKVHHDMGVTVIICEILFREVRNCKWPCCPDYNSKVTATNNEIREMCRHTTEVKYWHHRRMSQNWRQYISADGVHLSELGMVKYYRNFRSMVISNIGQLPQ